LDQEKKIKYVEDTKHELEKIIQMLISVKIEDAKNLKQTSVEFLESFVKEFNITLDKQTADKWENL
jgi:uncharacterized protein (DUF342 family)